MQVVVAVAELLMLQLQLPELAGLVLEAMAVLLYLQPRLAAMEQQTEVVVVEVAPMEFQPRRVAMAALA